jgi:membrane-associated protein
VIEMELIRKLIALLFGGLGDDAKWRAVLDHVGTTNLYVVLFAIVFAETGLVVTPFLPGDSLLFALGAIGVRDVGINLPVATALLIVAAVLGDAANYWIGYKLGPKVFTHDDPSYPAATASPTGGQLEYAPVSPKRKLSDRLLNRKHLLKAQEFYDKYGGKTIILARFVPVVRTFAPFVAGVGKMSYAKFFLYNVVGAIAWVLICVGAGVAFGNVPFVRKNFELVLIAVVAISLLPMAIEFYRAWRASKTAGSTVVEATTISKTEPTPAE